MVSVLDGGAKGPGVHIVVATLSGNSLSELFSPIVLLFIKQRKW